MKVAIASSNLFYNSAAAISRAGDLRQDAVMRTSQRSRRALLQVEDRAGHAFEIVLRALLGSSLLVALGETCWQLAQP